MPFTQLRDFRLYLHTPTPIFKARVNLASPTYPLTSLPFDGVTLGTFDLIHPDMTLILGTTDGADDLGRVRVQNVATSTTIPVGRISQGIEDGTLNVQDNAYITVWGDDWRVWAKIPYIDPDGNTYKDSNVEVNDYMTDIPPVSNCGPGFADYIDDDDIITVTFDGTASYAMADGATISTYAWSIEDGTVTLGDIDEDTVTVTFPAGFRWVGLTVTDSNGVPHTSRCPVLAVDPANDHTIKFQVPSHRIEMRGQTIGFELFDNLSRATFPDGGLVMFWADEPIDPTDRSHMWFIGYHQNDSFGIRATSVGLIRTTVLNCVDVAGRLATLPGFPQALERSSDSGWEYMPTLDMRKCLHYLAFWHSTALSLADFIMDEGLSDYPAMRLDSTGASLYEQINSRAQSCVPDHWLTCNIQGQLFVKPDWMLLDFDDRPVDTAGTFTEDFWSDIRADYTRPPRVYVLNSAAVVCSTDWLELGGEDTLPLAFCKAPGYAFGQGVSEATTNEKLTISQEQLNACEGHRYARLNARYGPFTIVEPTGDIQDFQPAHMLPVQVNISAATAAQRGLDFTTARGLVKSIDLRYNHTEFGTWVQPTVQWEREVVGLPAVTHIPDMPDDPDYEVPEPPPLTVPPDFGLIDGQELVAGIGLDGYIYRTSDFQTPSGSGGPTWTRVDTTIADTIYSFVVDPFSPGYINGSGAINGWIVNDTDIYRVTDLFGTVVATSVFTFDEPTVAASFHWRTIQASFGAYFAEGANPWLLCVSYYGDTAGHEGIWATRSTDGGVTWSAEVQISEFYDAATPTRFMPIGVYTSPKTPGLAYTAVYDDAGGTPSNLMPILGTAPDTGAVTVEGAGTSITWVTVASDVAGGSSVTVAKRGWFAPPPDAERVVTRLDWEWTTVTTGGGASTSGGLSDGEPTTITRDAASLGMVHPGDNGTTTGTITTTWTKAGLGDWPGNNVTVPDTHDDPANIRTVSIANGDTTSTITVTMTVTEIELEDGTIYTPTTVGAKGVKSTDWGASWVDDTLITPGRGLAGSIHLPWEDNAGETLAYFGYYDNETNREFRLHKSEGGVISDISPEDTAIPFGPNRFGFAIRAYDGDRQHLLMAGVGNDVSADPADDTHAIFYSDDAGATWTTVVAPLADSEAPAGRAALEAAFSGDDPAVHFYWGAENYIAYTSNAGVAVDSRAGNLAALGGSVYFVGIAGGSS